MKENLKQMSSDIQHQKKFTKTAIQWRRDMVFSKLVRGWSQAEIARDLQIHPSTISLDVQYLKEQSKKELETHLSDRLPFEYSRAMTGINSVLKRASDILDESKDNKTRMEAMRLLMDLWKSVMSLATDGGIVERVMRMVKVITPLPGEDLPAKSAEEAEAEEVEEDPPTEP
jgi:hypothetical protein